MVARGKIPPLDLMLRDVCGYYESFLEELYKLVAIMKVPGRKAKSYD